MPPVTRGCYILNGFAISVTSLLSLEQWYQEKIPILFPGGIQMQAAEYARLISIPPSKPQQQTIDAGIACSESLCHTLSVRTPAVFFFLLKFMVELP